MFKYHIVPLVWETERANKDQNGSEILRSRKKKFKWEGEQGGKKGKVKEAKKKRGKVERKIGNKALVCKEGKKGWRQEMAMGK